MDLREFVTHGEFQECVVIRFIPFPLLISCIVRRKALVATENFEESFVFMFNEMVVTSPVCEYDTRQSWQRILTSRRCCAPC
jgi:hypothetical protein